MNTVYDMMTVLPVSLLAVMLFGGYAGIPQEGFSGYALCLTVSVFLIFLRHMKKKARLCSIGIAAVFLAGLFLAAGKESRQVFLTEYFWIVRLCGLSVTALIAGMLVNRSVRLKRIAAAALLTGCIAGTVLKHEIGKGAFALICLLLLIRTAEEVQLKWKKSGYAEMKAHITRISPFFLALCLIVYSLPAPAKPYDWQIAKNLYQHTVTLANRIYGRFAHPSDDYAKTGFSDSGGFASELGAGDEEVLSVHADHTTIGLFRLVGSIGSDFDGRAWTFGPESGDAARMLDTMETVCAVRKYADTARSDYLQKVDLHYENRFYNTRYIFAPAKIKLEATKEQGTAELYEQNGSIFSVKRLRYREAYTVLCHMLNDGHPQLADLLSSAEPITEDEWKQTAAAESTLNKAGYSFADYQRYRGEVYESFCRPRGVSEKTGAVLAGILDSAANRYEAAKLLEAYLSSMEYSVSCGALPDTVTDSASFLDYFLFTSKKGYCMHYATAFVLMANEMGIPCRYVQGYRVKKDGYGNMTVKQSNAHAWPEVYFDHVGWVAFEPTPGYGGHAGWELRTSDPSAYYRDRANAENSIVPDGTDNPLPDPDGGSAGINPLIFMIPSLCVLCFLLVFLIISRLITAGKYRQMDCNEKYRYLAQQNIRYIGYLGFRMKPDETLAEYRSRVMQSEQQDIRECLAFIPVYETVLYSDRTITAEEVSAAEQMHQTLRGLVKKSRLRFRLLLLLRKQ